MKCGTNDYVPEEASGRTMSNIVSKFADDNEVSFSFISLWWWTANNFFKPIEVFAEKFFEGWQKMTSNGYDDGVLVDGPESAWFGHYSLMKKLQKKVDLFW